MFMAAYVSYGVDLTHQGLPPLHAQQGRRALHLVQLGYLGVRTSCSRRQQALPPEQSGGNNAEQQSTTLGRPRRRRERAEAVLRPM